MVRGRRQYDSTKPGSDKAIEAYKKSIQLDQGLTDAM